MVLLRCVAAVVLQYPKRCWTPLGEDHDIICKGGLTLKRKVAGARCVRGVLLVHAQSLPPIGITAVEESTCVLFWLHFLVVCLPEP